MKEILKMQGEECRFGIKYKRYPHNYLKNKLIQTLSVNNFRRSEYFSFNNYF